MKTIFVGDVSPTDVSAPLFETEDMLTLFDDALPLFKDKDIVFCNLECAITDSDKPIKKFGPPLKAPYSTAKVLKKLGVTVAGLSNNHIFDFGIQGVKDTMKALDDVGIPYTGFGDNYEASKKNHIIEKNGEKIAIIAVCEHEYSYALEDRMGARPFDEFETIYEIQLAKKECDRVIVAYHGGKEECRYPSPRLLKACRAMARAGADLVLCQHTHCVGCYEEFEGCHILYGQGNFHFARLAGIPEAKVEYWKNALIVVYDTITGEIGFVPMNTLKNGIELAKGESKAEILSGFEKRNRELQTGEWKKGWHEFCESKRESYSTPYKPEEIDKFSHQLDCEAHCDVLRELFKTWNHTNEK